MDLNGWIIIGILIATSLGKALFAGNRGSLIQIFTIIVLAYILSDRKFKLKQMIKARDYVKAKELKELITERERLEEEEFKVKT